jgi:hypothetical protein
MKQLIAIVTSVFALTAFAADAPKAPDAKPTAEVKKDSVKPAKSETKAAPAKDAKAAK